MSKTLHVYVDELGDVGPFDPRSPIYLVSLVFLDETADRFNRFSVFAKAKRAFGEGTFVHVGNLIRGEWPYEGILLERRQAFFWSFLAYAAGLNFKFITIRVEKEKLLNGEQLGDALRKGLWQRIDQNVAFFSEYDLFVVHYDCGQK